MTATGYVSTTGDTRKVNKSGDTLTGDLVLVDSSPDTDLSAAPRVYVDTAVAGAQHVAPWVFDVTAAAYGAKGDAQVVADGAMSSGSAVLTSATANWPTSVVGKAISVKGAAATGVTTLVATVASRQSSTQITLSAANASGGAVSNAVVIWGTDDSAAIQAAVDAAEAYLVSHTYAQVYFPPRPYIVAGALNTAKSGSGQIVFGVYPTSGLKRTLEFRGEGDGAAAVRHWEQTVPQHAGSCLISLGVYSSTSAQIADLNANGNPGVISGPNEGASNGLAYGAAARFSNVMPVLKDLAILTTHSFYGLTYGAFNLYGCANAYLENVGYGTAGVVPGSDYTSPGTFGTGLSIGGLLPAPGNNDHVIARNLSCGGGYTYALFLTEHAVMDRYMALYCWAGLCAVGSYAGSVGSVHAMKILSASIEACTNELYIVGVGSSGIGPIIDIDQLSTENGAPTVSGNSPAALNGALGKVRFTGLFNEAGVNTTAPTGIELINGQVPVAIKRKATAFTCSPIDRALVCDTTAGGFTGTLPAADYCPVQYEFRNTGANTLTVAAAAGQVIYTGSGAGTATVAVPAGQTLRVQALYTGAAWSWYALQRDALPTTGGTVTGDLTVEGYTTLNGGQFNSDFAAFGNMTLIGTGKRIRFRRDGAKVDVEGAGTDSIWSMWSAEDFSGTQHVYMRLESGTNLAHACGNWIFADTPDSGAVHSLLGSDNKLGFHGAAAVSQQTVSGSRGGNAALASLITKLATLGLIVDGTS